MSVHVYGEVERNNCLSNEPLAFEGVWPTSYSLVATNFAIIEILTTKGSFVVPQIKTTSYTWN